MYKVMAMLTIVVLFTACQNSKNEENVHIKRVIVKKEFSKFFYECERERSETTAGMSSCFEEELKEQDKRLNVEYQKAKASIQPFRIDSLKSVQKKWIVYRDSKCDFFFHKESGSSGSLDRQECLIKETISRTKELKEIF